MRGTAGLRVGRRAGAGVFITWTWPLSVAVIAAVATPLVEQVVPGTGRGTAIAVSALLGVLLGLCVLVHEWGHCLAARLLGFPVHQVRLYLLGGVTELGRTPTRPRDEWIIAGAGPVLSAVIGLACWWAVELVTPATLPWLIVVELALANLVIAVFNVLPALPLDGGRVLRAGVWQVTGRRRAGTVAALVGSAVVAVALIVWSVLVVGDGTAGAVQAAVAVTMALFLLWGGLSEHRAERTPEWPSDLPLSRLARPVVSLPAEIPLDLALQAAGTRVIALTGADHVLVGLLDPEGVPPTASKRPAREFAVPVPPEAVILSDDDPAGLRERLGRAGPLLVLIDDEGRPTGAVRAADVAGVLDR